VPVTGTGDNGPVSYTFDDDPSRLDLDVIWSFLSTEAYWHRWRTRADVERQVAGAWRVVGGYDETGAQVAFARALSDGVCEAYLADVFVVAGHRGRGLGKALVAEMIDAGPGAHLRWTLFTGDAHGLYAQFGFAPPDDTAMVRPARRDGT
jgi:GNAT superfamily N-acetyltransferase